MAQVGNYHVGKAETSISPTLSIIEASLLWQLLDSRYKCVEETQIYLNYAHDSDLKRLIKTGLYGLLERQINILEDQMDKFKIPLPPRPPKSVNTEDKIGVLDDQFMLRQVFEGCQTHIDYLARITRSMIHNDALRNTISTFLKDELSIFNDLCKYGKLKGWLAVSPIYHS